MIPYIVSPLSTPGFPEIGPKQYRGLCVYACGRGRTPAHAPWVPPPRCPSPARLAAQGWSGPGCVPTRAWVTRIPPENGRIGLVRRFQTPTFTHRRTGYKNRSTVPFCPISGHLGMYCRRRITPRTQPQTPDPDLHSPPPRTTVREGS